MGHWHRARTFQARDGGFDRNAPWSRGAPAAEFARNATWASRPHKRRWIGPWRVPAMVSPTAGRSGSARQPFMRAVAERGGGRVLAPAPSDLFRLGDIDPFGRETGTFVRAVAERLVFRIAAGAPRIGARSGVLDVGKFLSDVRLVHGGLRLRTSLCDNGGERNPRLVAAWRQRASADWRQIQSGTGLPTRELETMGQETHATQDD